MSESDEGEAREWLCEFCGIPATHVLHVPNVTIGLCDSCADAVTLAPRVIPTPVSPDS